MISARAPRPPMPAGSDRSETASEPHEEERDEEERVMATEIMVHAQIMVHGNSGAYAPKLSREFWCTLSGR